MIGEGDTASCVMSINQNDAITALLVADECSIWTIIALGSIIVLDFGTGSILCF
jgi:hypothetical protein